MSDSGGYETVTVESEGVTVTKRFEEDEFPVPAIAFEFTSEREDAVGVRLSDRVPDGVAVEDLGFHPEYGSEYWTIDEETISFERDIEPGAEYTTVYGIRATGADDVEQFLTEPVLEEVDPPITDGTPDDAGGEGEDEVSASSTDIVADVITGESEGPDLDEDDEEEGSGEDIETLDLKDPNAPDETSADGTADTGSAVADIEAGNVVSAMATEIRNNDVAVDDLKLLKRAFDHVAEETTEGSTDARIEKLQSDVADLRAYTDALEEFLDENGTAEQLIGEFEERLDQFAADLDSVRSEMDDSVGAVRTDVEDVETTVRNLEGAVEDLRTSVEELESQVTDEDVMERMEDVESDLGDLKEWQEQIKATFGG